MSGTLGLHNPLRYRGYIYDRETGLYYLQSRYYNPTICRFISADSLIASGTAVGVNQFVYCCNNPVSYSDPTGHWLETVFDLFSLGVSFVDVIKDPSDPWAWAGLAADVASLAVPFATGGGTIVKVATKADEVVDTVKTVNKAANVVDTTQDVAKTTVKNLNFDSTENLLKHFTDHNSQFGELFSSADEYLSGANYVINNGQFVPELNGYIRFFGTGGRANYAFVGLKNAGKNISTFHVKGVRELAKIPSLGFYY